MRRRVRVSAPLRADLTGGFTDCEPFLTHQPARMVSLALDHRVIVDASEAVEHSALRLSDGRSLLVDLPRLDSSRPPSGIAQLVARLLRTVGITARLDIGLPLPLGCGTGTSAAVLIAALQALLELRGTPDVPRCSLPHLAAGVERLAGHLGGLQDQFAATYGGLTHYHFHDRGVDVHHLDQAAAGIFRDAALAVPPPDHDRQGSDRLVNLVTARSRSGSADTAAALRGLVELGERIALSLGSDRPDIADLEQLILAVLDRQRQLHPEIRAGIDESLPYELVCQRAMVGKPVGGAGRGSAWFLLTATESARRRLGSAGWVIHSVRISDSGVRTEGEPDL